MKKHTKIAGIALLVLTGTMLTVQAVAHDRDHERRQDYRSQMGGYMGGPGSMPPPYWNQGPWMKGPFDMRGHHGMPFRGHRHMDTDYADILADRLDLTKEQRGAVDDIVKKSRREMRDLWEEHRDNRHDLHKMIRHGIQDQAAFGKLAEKQGQLTTRLIKLRAELRTRIVKILDENQQRRLSGEDLWYETW